MASNHDLEFRIRFNPETGGIEVARRELNDLGDNSRRASSETDRLISSIGKIAGAVGGIYAVNSALKSSIETTMSFEKSIDRLGAVTNSSVSQIESLEQKALDLGKSTEYTARQVSDAETYLAMSGMKTNEILTATEDALKLASIGSLELGTSADVLSNIMSGFTLKADQANRVVDVMSATITNANVDIRMLGETMKYTASEANMVGATVEEVSALAGVLGNAGKQGSEAGTALRAMFTRLSSPPTEAQKMLSQLNITTKDTSGNLKNIVEIFGELKSKTDQLGSADKVEALSKLFGVEAAGAGAIILNNYDTELKKLLKTISEADALNVSDKIYKQMTDNLDNAVKTMGSAIENLQIQATKPFLEPLKNQINVLSASITEFADSNKDTFKTIAQNTIEWAGYIDDVVIAYGAFKASGWIIAGLTTLTTTMQGVSLTMTAYYGILRGVLATQRAWNALLLASPVGILALAIWGAYEAYQELGKQVDDGTTKVIKYKSETDKLIESLNKMGEAGKNGEEIAKAFNDSEIKRVTKEIENLNRIIENGYTKGDSLKRAKDQLKEYEQELKKLQKTSKELTDSLTPKPKKDSSLLLCNDKCKDENKKLIDNIEKMWVSTTKTKEEQNDIWLGNELKTLENSNLLAKDKLKAKDKLYDIWYSKLDGYLEEEIQKDKRKNDKKLREDEKYIRDRLRLFSQFQKRENELTSLSFQKEKLTNPFANESEFNYLQNIKSIDDEIAQIEKEKFLYAKNNKEITDEQAKTWQDNIDFLNDKKKLTKDIYQLENDELLKLENKMTQHFQSGFSEILTGAKSLEDSLKDIFKNIGQDIINSFATNISKMASNAIVGLGNDILGSFVGSGSSGSNGFNLNSLSNLSSLGLGGTFLAGAGSALGIGGLTAVGTTGALGAGFGAGLGSWTGGLSGVTSTIGSAGSLGMGASITAGALAPLAVGYGLYKLGWSDKSKFESGLKVIDEIEGYVNKDIEEVQKYDSWKKKSAFSTKKWDTTSDFTTTDQIKLNTKINPFQSILEEFNKTIEIEAGKYNSKTLNKKLVMDFFEKLYNVDTQGIEDIKDTSLKNIYKEWEAYAKSVGTTVEEAVTSVVGQATQNIKNLEMLTLGENEGTLAVEKAKVADINKELAKVGDNLGVNIEDWDIIEFTKQYKEAIKTTKGEELAYWNTAYQLFMSRRDVQNQFNKSLQESMVGVLETNGGWETLTSTQDKLKNNTLDFNGAVDLLVDTLGITSDKAKDIVTTLQTVDNLQVTPKTITYETAYKDTNNTIETCQSQ